LIAHVLTGSPIPAAVQWLLAALLFGGALAAAWLRSGRRRLIAAGVAGCALVATLASWVIAALQPGAAAYAVRIVAPQQNAVVSSQVALTVCGFYPDGTKVPATDAQHYLIVFVDGVEAATVDRSQIVYALSNGTHTIKTELVTPAHHAFDPPQIAEVTIRVRAIAPSGAAEAQAAC
jgi:hypothetical protein